MDDRAPMNGCDGPGGNLSRREFLRRSLAAGAGALCALSMPGMQAGAAAEVTGAATEAATAGRGRARAVIQIWMWGGPAHLDTFDPKPGAGISYTGPLDRPIDTNVPGIRIGQLLPLLAKQADKYAILRGMTHGINAHETASYIVQTGHDPGDRVVYPAAGAVVSYFKGYAGGYGGLIPPYIVLTEPQGRFSEAGFLGVRYKPFATGGNPARTPFAVEGVVAAGITAQRQQSRRDLLRALDTLARNLQGDRELGALRRAQDEAYELILGDAGKVFDLTEEKDEMRENYGRNTFGQSCLAARRLVERGVPYITLTYSGWDTHKDHFGTMRRQLPELDQGMSALLADLSSRGLLDRTIVWWCGEFGRTPRVEEEAPWNGGRGHYGKAFCAVLAGGGFKGGRVVGATDATGSEVIERPVAPAEVICSIYQLLGIDRAAKLPHPQGLDVTAYPAGPGGTRVLSEIM